MGTVWLVSTPSAARMPTSGAQKSCQRTRTRAGASKAMKPQIVAANKMDAVDDPGRVEALAVRRFGLEGPAETTYIRLGLSRR